MSTVSEDRIFEIPQPRLQNPLAREAAALVLQTFEGNPFPSNSAVDNKIGRMDGSNSALLVAVDQRENFLGTGSVMLLGTKAGEIGYLLDLVIVPQQRGKGLGKKFMGALENKARALGAGTTALLATEPEFYEKLGYERARDDLLSRPPGGYVTCVKSL